MPYNPSAGREDVTSVSSGAIDFARNLSRRKSAGAKQLLLRGPAVSSDNRTKPEAPVYLEGQILEKLGPSMVLIKTYTEIQSDVPDPLTGEKEKILKIDSHGTGFCVKVVEDSNTGERFAYFATNRHVVPVPSQKIDVTPS